MIATPSSFTLSAEEYLAWEPRQELRYEYVSGVLVAMTGGTVPHNDIAVNLLTSIHGVVRERGGRINIADVKLQVTKQGSYRYPDLLVTCDDRDFQEAKFVRFPTLIVEVLSPGTESVDRGDKWNEYRQIESLQEYVLVNASKIGVEVYRRGEGRMWLYSPYGKGDVVRLESLGVEVAIATLYANILFLNA